MLTGIAALCLAGTLPAVRGWGSWGPPPPSGSWGPTPTPPPPPPTAPPSGGYTRYNPGPRPGPPPPPSPKWEGYGVPSPEPKEECETIVHSHTEEWLSKATKNAAGLSAPVDFST